MRTKKQFPSNIKTPITRTHHSTLSGQTGRQEPVFLQGHVLWHLSQGCGWPLQLSGASGSTATFHTHCLEGSTTAGNGNPFLLPGPTQSSHTHQNFLSQQVQSFYRAKINSAVMYGMHWISLPASLPGTELNWTHEDMNIFPSRKIFFRTEVSKHIISLYTVISLHYWEQITSWHVLQELFPHP